ncbi:YaiI/YqxD family protein [Xylanivirga thermophila]|jgi:uncharacterized protein YaiI (UPF0178 family)|uniref:YaiI/YqxD family protein n=1 Tax=Xylanivirga thermophila TaxID=2496273 RepID=UPI00101CA0E6|nr:DUF188 domain-containing protein [Xylanivirga thermophila]
MKIFIDGDGCPVVNLTIKIAKSYGIKVIVVKDISHELWDDYATIITVDQSPDSADFYIANNITKGDIVVTQDYGLSAMVLAKEALCITQNGLVISPKNIDQLLGYRHFNQELRRKHKKYTKIKKRSSQSDMEFKKNLSALIETKSKAYNQKNR